MAHLDSADSAHTLLKEASELWHPPLCLSLSVFLSERVSLGWCSLSEEKKYIYILELIMRWMCINGSFNNSMTRNGWSDHSPCFIQKSNRTWKHGLADWYSQMCPTRGQVPCPRSQQAGPGRHLSSKADIISGSPGPLDHRLSFSPLLCSHRTQLATARTVSQHPEDPLPTHPGDADAHGASAQEVHEQSQPEAELPY